MICSQVLVLVLLGSRSLSDTNLVLQVASLTYKEKFTAGSWRFLTYFGRDTLIALRLFMVGHL